MMGSIASLGYVVIQAQKLEEWRSFCTEILGMMEVNQSDGDLFFKMDEHPFRITVEQAEEDCFVSAGWQTPDQGAFESLCSKLEQEGIKVEHLDEAVAQKRQVAALACAYDPSGNRFEFYYGRKRCDRPFVSPLGLKRFITGDMGLGHVVLCAPKLDECHSFYKNILGFRLSDILTPRTPKDMPEIKVIFMHADNPRHHSVGLCNLDLPSKLVHLMVEVPAIDDVGLAFDRCRKKKIPFMATLGRHTNDQMLSFYVFSPSGFAVEYGCEGLQLDWKNFEPTESISGDLWGHEYRLG